MTKLEILLCAIIAGLCLAIIMQIVRTSRKNAYIRTLESYLEYRNQSDTR